MQKITIKLLLLFTLLLPSINVYAAPFHGDIFQYYQPDGSTFQIRLYGDEFYAVAETLDGYTIVRDPQSGFFCYARLSADESSLESTGVQVNKSLMARSKMERGIRISHSSMLKKSRAAREQYGVNERGVLLPEKQSILSPKSAIKNELQPAPPSSTTTGTRVGIILLAQFPDRPQDVTVSRSEVDAYANDPEYTGFGNATSVYGYFNIQSDGKLQYNNIVTAYFTAAQNRAYYTDNAISFGSRAKELINEGLSILQSQGFDFTKADSDNNSVIDGVSLLYAGNRTNSWSEGLWPHKSSSSWTGLSEEGVSTSFQYQIIPIGSSLTLGTFCHESSHMIANFPDLYSYNGNAARLGAYSLMYQSGTTHPVHIDAYLKVHAGWADVIDITSDSHLRGSVQVDKNRFYRYLNPNNSLEYFLISMRTNSGYEGIYGGAASAVNPTSGLVVWHALENGSNTYSSIFTGDSPHADYSTPYELMVVEANPSSYTIPWYDAPNPGSNDGYHSEDINTISDSTTPALKFWNTSTGRTTPSNLTIHSIQNHEDTMTFTIGSGGLTSSPAIATNVSTLSPTCNYGTDAASQNFTVFNEGGGTLNYALSESISWLSLNVASGTATTESDIVTISYDTKNLESNTYSGTITITDSNATNSPQTITVNLTVLEQPAIYLESTTLAKTLKTGGSDSGSFIITNSGGGTLAYTLNSSTSWLTLGATSGTVAAEVDEIEVSFDASNLFNGTHYGTITVNSTNATIPTQTINVTLTVTGSLIVRHPSGGEILWQGNKYTLEWGTDNTVADNVKIDLYKGDILDSTLAESTSNDGQYIWTIPSDQSIGADYSIRISSVTDQEKFGESYTTFSIAASPTLISIPYSESFESSFGSWGQSASDDFDWTRISGPTPSLSTGPSGAQDGSYYIFTESTGNSPSKTATLDGYFDLSSAAAPLLRFYYQMYGSTIGTLVVKVSADQQIWNTVFSRTGEQGNVWHEANIDLSAFAGQAVSVQLSGTTGDSFTSDIALDNLTINTSTKTLSYSSNTFTEDLANNGSISNKIVITLSGDTFTSTAVSDGYVSAENVPTGLTAQFVRNSSTQITMSLVGNALSHGNIDNISELKVRIVDSAFTAGNASAVTGSVTDLWVDYVQNDIINYNVNAIVDNNGTLDTSSLSINHGLRASFNITPNIGYTTDIVVGGDCPAGLWSNSTYTTGPIVNTCNVSFTHTLKSYTVTSSVTGTGGTIDPLGAQSVKHGMKKQFNLKPFNGYLSDTVSENCGGFLSANIYTTDAITSDCEVIASFIAQYSLEVIMEGDGQGTVTSNPAGINCEADCDELYRDSTSVTLLATPDEGSSFIGWSGDEDCKDGSVTVRGDVNCIANFSTVFPWSIFMPAILNGKSLP